MKLINIIKIIKKVKDFKYNNKEYLKNKTMKNL